MSLTGYYNLTGISNARSIVGILKEVNTLSGSVFSVGFLFVLWVVAFVSIYSNDKSPKYAFSAASFLCATTSIGFRLVGLVKDQILFMFIALVALSVVWLYIDK